jgi:hypothetical protein
MQPMQFGNSLSLLMILDEQGGLIVNRADIGQIDGMG